MRLAECRESIAEHHMVMVHKMMILIIMGS